MTRCFLAVFVWILWQHWKDSMEKKRNKNSPFKNSSKAIRGSEGHLLFRDFLKKSRSGVSITIQINKPHNFNHWGAPVGAPSKFQAPNAEVLWWYRSSLRGSKPGCCSSEWYRWQDLWNTPDSRRSAGGEGVCCGHHQLVYHKTPPQDVGGFN